MTSPKITTLKTEIAHWHSQRKLFTLKQIATLLGTLDDLCQVCPWQQFSFIAIRASVLKLTRKNKQLIHKKKTFKHYLQDTKSQSSDEVSLLKNEICYQ